MKSFGISARTRARRCLGFVRKNPSSMIGKKTNNHVSALCFLFLGFLGILCIALLFSACQTQGRSNDGNPSDLAPSASGSGEIMMAVFYSDVSHLKAAALLYEEKTGIKVNIQKTWAAAEYIEFEAIDRWGNPTTEAIFLNPSDTSAYTEQALASLMAGSGADIYDVSHLDFGNLGMNGLILDMGGWLENDAEFADDIVFRDILLSGKTEGGVFAAPLDFFFRKLHAAYDDEPLFEDRQMMRQERMTWREFMDKAVEFGYTQEIAFWLLDLDIFMERFLSRASFFIDETGNTQNLNSGDMISLLEECRDWRDMGLCKGYGDRATMAAPYSYADYGITHRTAEGLCTLPEEYMSAYGNYKYFAPMPFDGDPVNIDGKNRYPELDYGSQLLYGVNAGSSNAETAQDFLRFLLSEAGQEKMLGENPLLSSFGLPLNRTVFRGMVESDLERIQTSAGGSLELDVPGLIDEAEEAVDQIAYIIIQKPYYRTIIREVAKQFFLDQISAEEAARQMADKVGLYLMEQG